MKKVYVEHQELPTSEMFTRHGWSVTNHVDEADLVCFIGGADVSPILYGEENTHSYADAHLDLQSIRLYWDAQDNDLPCVGICRGGQFLNVMNGGTMIQHIDGHENTQHRITVDSENDEWDGNHYMVNSGHHQAILPNESVDVELVAYTDDGNCEIVVYGGDDKTDICFQAHPEWGNNADTEELFFNLIDQFIDTDDNE